MTARPDDPQLGRTLGGQYRIEALLGFGGMGRVYRGRQLSVNRPVAIKLIAGQAPHPAEWVQRFRREAEATASLSHPNSVRLFDFGVTESEELFMVMELLEGTDLARQLQAHGPLPLLTALSVARQVLLALCEAHELGITHRDIKPDNIFLASVRGADVVAKVMDFGIAGLAHAQRKSRLTGTGVIIGTPLYMSPEQAQGLDVDSKSDVYSLGVVLFEMLTGRPVFDSNTAVTLLLAHVARPPRRLDEAGVELREQGALQALLDRMLAKDPGERPSATAALEEITRLSSRLGVAGATGSMRAVTPPPAASTRAEEFQSVRDSGMHTGPLLRPSIFVVGAVLVLTAAGALALRWLPSALDTVQPSAATSPAPEREPETRKVQIQSQPSGAQVLVDGTKVGTTPYELELQRDTEVSVARDGYARQLVTVAYASRSPVLVKLVASKRAVAEEGSAPFFFSWKRDSQPRVAARADSAPARARATGALAARQLEDEQVDHAAGAEPSTEDARSQSVAALSSARRAQRDDSSTLAVVPGGTSREAQRNDDRAPSPASQRDDRAAERGPESAPLAAAVPQNPGGDASRTPRGNESAPRAAAVPDRGSRTPRSDEGAPLAAAVPQSQAGRTQRSDDATPLAAAVPQNQAGRTQRTQRGDDRSTAAVPQNQGSRAPRSDDETPLAAAVPQNQAGRTQRSDERATGEVQRDDREAQRSDERAPFAEAVPQNQGGRTPRTQRGDERATGEVQPDDREAQFGDERPPFVEAVPQRPGGSAPRTQRSDERARAARVEAEHDAPARGYGTGKDLFGPEPEPGAEASAERAASRRAAQPSASETSRSAATRIEAIREDELSEIALDDDERAHVSQHYGLRAFGRAVARAVGRLLIPYPDRARRAALAQEPLHYFSFREARSAYKRGDVNATEFSEAVWQLRERRRKQIWTERDRYARGELTQAQYEARIDRIWDEFWGHR